MTDILEQLRDKGMLVTRSELIIALEAQAHALEELDGRVRSGLAQRVEDVAKIEAQAKEIECQTERANGVVNAGINMVAQAVLAEREACLQELIKLSADPRFNTLQLHALFLGEKAIRARGEN